MLPSTVTESWSTSPVLRSCGSQTSSSRNVTGAALSHSVVVLVAVRGPLIVIARLSARIAVLSLTSVVTVHDGLRARSSWHIKVQEPTSCFSA